MAKTKEIKIAIIANAPGREKILEKAFRKAIEIFGIKVVLSISTLNAFDNQLPNPTKIDKEFDGIVVSGSPYGVHDLDTQPWIKAEINFLKVLLKNNFPIMAVCFGHQALAKAAGAEIRTSLPDQEIGIMNINLTDIGKKSVFSKLPATSFLATQSHQDHLVTVPEGATPLAYSVSSGESKLLIVQALLYGKKQISIQYHPEYDRDAMEELFKKAIKWFVDHGVDIDKLRADYKDYDNYWALLIYAHWLRLLST